MSVSAEFREYHRLEEAKVVAWAAYTARVWKPKHNPPKET
jgi:hypothetical protein